MPFDFLTKAFQLLFGQPPFKERPGINSRCGMSLEEHEIGAVFCLRTSPEVVESYVIESRG